MYDVIVIGGGPAGMTAALYAARAGKSVMLLESNAFGGQIATSPRVENFPSVADIDGAELANRMFEQIVAHDVEFNMGTAEVHERDGLFEVVTEFDKYTARAVVLATGVSHKTLGLESESRLAGNGVCYCAVCDGSFHKDKPVTVVGDGNTAAQYALYLADICSEVSLLTLTERLFCDDELAKRIAASEKIDWVRGVSVRDIVGDDKVQAVVYADADGAITYLDTDAVFIAIGQQPHNGAFAELVKLDEQGYIVAGEDCKTSAEGVFVAGDCRTKSVRQCTTAVADGAVAGLAAAAWADKIKRSEC